MAGIDNLTNAERARLLGKPDGELGLAMGEAMNRANGQLIEAVYSRLGLKRGLHLLEIGFGNGKLLPPLMQLAEDLTYVGFDISATMVAEAVSRNEALVTAGRAAFHVASAEHIPCVDATFDRAFAVNVIYFWPEPIQALTEIRRVLRPTGTCIVAAIDPETAASAPYMRSEFGFHVRDRVTLAALHRDAGFSEIDVQTYEDKVTRVDGTPWSRHFSIVIAQP